MNYDDYLQNSTGQYIHGRGYEIVVKGDIAYIAAGEGGLQIVSVTGPGVPALLAELALTHDGDHLALSDVDDILFVIEAYSGVTSVIYTRRL